MQTQNILAAGLVLLAMALPVAAQDRAETAAGIRAGYAEAVRDIHRQLQEDLDCQLQATRVDFMLQAVDTAQRAVAAPMLCAAPLELDAGAAG